jgi:hypothetical protein
LAGKKGAQKCRAACMRQAGRQRGGGSLLVQRMCDAGCGRGTVRGQVWLGL